MFYVTDTEFLLNFIKFLLNLCYLKLVVTCEINTEIISKLLQCFISHVTTSETEIKLFEQLKEF